MFQSPAHVWLLTHGRLLVCFHHVCLLPSGAVYPTTGPLDKDKGRLLSKPFGPATSWHLQFSTSGFTVVVGTAQGTYLLSKPSATYRKVFAALEEQANLTWHVLQVRRARGDIAAPNILTVLPLQQGCWLALWLLHAASLPFVAQ